MKNAYLSLSAAVLALSTSVVQAQELPTLYGKANVSFNNTDLEGSDPGVDEFRLNSNASRLGVKGKYAINDDIEAIYQLEFEVFIDDGQSSGSKGNDTFEQRNIFAGFRGDFGEIIAGRFDTPMKLSEGKIDRFNDLELGDIDEVISGQDRVSNIVMYTSPDYSGVTFKAAIIPGEDSAGDDSDDGPADGISISAEYKQDAWYFAAATNSDVEGLDVLRLVAVYQVCDELNVGALWQTAEDSSDSSIEEDSFVISAEYTLNDKWKLEGQLVQGEYENFANGRDEETQFVAGAEYKLSGNAKLFGYASQIERETTIDSEDDTTLAFGFEIKF